ncbi:hypothetical protein WJU16_00730 [Chitinophaga pollutisoli]|uniref:Uncharacterized protein n=1 Tax=Chitinophaga pollutisoli TaxID=3133966 RepID=A0ABZ2YRK4_9BACT
MAVGGGNAANGDSSGTDERIRPAANGGTGSLPWRWDDLGASWIKQVAIATSARHFTTGHLPYP